ncbi:MAG: lysophospholipid acyltransferase family protein, partial [bacterium]
MLLGFSILAVELLLKAFYGFRVSGLEKIPKSGRLIIACNHISVVDPPALGVAVSRVRKVYCLAKKELFHPAPAGWYLRDLGCIPVDRGRSGGDLGAIRAVMSVLSGENSIIIFPEGTRARKGIAPDPKPGIGLIAKKSGAPVLTARIFGTGRFPERNRITVSFGRLMRFEPGPAETRKAYTDFAA